MMPNKSKAIYGGSSTVSVRSAFNLYKLNQSSDQQQKVEDPAKIANQFNTATH